MIVNGVNVHDADLALNSILDKKKNVELELDELSGKLVDITYLEQLKSNIYVLSYLEELVVNQLRIAFE